MKTKRPLLLLLLVIVLVAIPTFTVFAKELGLLTIMGPGITGEVSLNDHEAMMNLEQAGFFSTSALAKAPDNINMDLGYNITAHLNLDGKLVPFVQMIYYPTEAGKPAYVHYIGRLEGESLQAVNEWSILNREADNALRNLMVANDIALQSALVAGTVSEASASAAKPVVESEPVVAVQPVTNSEPVTAPVAVPALNSSAYTIFTVAAIFLLMIGAGLVIRRRTVSHRAT